MKRRNFLLYATLFLLSACTATPIASERQAATESASLPIQKPDKIRFAVSDVQGMEDLQKDYEALRVLLAEILDLPVEFFPVDSYIAAAAALQQDQVDLVFTGPSEYVVMRARTNAVPIAAIKRDRYYPVLVTTADSAVKSVADLKGKTIAMWEVGSTSGYLGPMQFLIDAGLDPKTDVTIALLAKEGLPALKAGKVDVWAGSIRRYDTFLESENLTEADLPILRKGPDLPPDPFVVNSRMDAGFAAEMQKLFFQNQSRILQAIEPADGAKFTGATMVEVQDTDYDSIRAAYRAVGQGAFL
ncbi:phosphate/phosphite/phosphonate ABC transporter substrate-binding protein [Trichothermofontia sp.]